MATVPPVGPHAEFLRTLQDLKVKAVCGREYIRVNKLEEWLNKGNPKNVDRLLDSCRRHRRQFTKPTSMFTHGRKKCLRIFSILLELGEGHLIDSLRDRGFIDGQLPLDLAKLEKDLKDKPALAKAFDAAQWKYCPLEFEFQEQETEASAELIVPICIKERIGKGGTSVVYQILVQEEFVRKALREVVPSSRYQDRKYGVCYFFALKTYLDGNEKLYENEINAFRGLSNNKGMIKWLFNYSHVEDEEAGKTTYNIVLEYGEYDLEQYFKEHLPPQLEDEQLSFWSDLFLVADAIKNLHEFTNTSGGVPKNYYGWHADIKPANILNVRGEFKLADPGFARFEMQDDRHKGGKDDTILLGTTETFGAPEFYKNPRPGGSSAAPVTGSRSIDIWSLGCVFSYAATWMVYGNDGLEQFAELRTEAISRIRRRQSNEKAQNFEKGSDCFHNGQTLLQDILHWHEFLRRGIRRSDTITAKVLQLVETRMLLEDDKARISARDLCLELQKIEAPPSGLPPLPESIRAALTRTEEKWADASRAKAGVFASKPVENLGLDVLIPSSRTLLPAQGGPKAHLFTSRQTSHRSKVAGKTSNTTLAPSRVFITTDSEDTSSRIIVQYPEGAQDAQPISGQSANKVATPSPVPEVSPPQGPSTTAMTGDRVGTTVMTSPTQVSLKSRRTFSITWPRFKSKKERDHILSQHYFERDIMYLIDNGPSMRPHWTSVRQLLIDLVTLSQHIDENGMDLRFTCSQTKFRASNNPRTFAAEMDQSDHRPKTGLHPVETNMSLVLGQILAKYIDDYRRSKAQNKKMTIIVLTDGIWAGMTDKFAVDRKIIEFNQSLSRLRGNSLEDDERRLSIQFVRFGNDPSAVRRLKRLDDQLKFKGVPDIVDTVPWDGSQYKMLLGSFVEHMDENDEEGTTGLESQDISNDHSPTQSALSSQRTLSNTSRSEHASLTREPSEMELPQPSQQPRVGEQQVPRRTETPSQQSRTMSQDKPRQPSFSISQH